MKYIFIICNEEIILSRRRKVIFVKVCKFLQCTHIEPALRYNHLHLQQQQKQLRITNLFYAIPETPEPKSQNFLGSAKP